MSDIRLIAAVGRNGQIGLDGKLPWRDPADLKWFREQTMGGIVVMGGRTHASVGDLDGRAMVVWGGKTDPAEVIADLESVKRVERTPSRIIWIAGGAKTYEAFRPFVRRAIVTLIDYDGPADTWMPWMWGLRPW